MSKTRSGLKLMENYEPFGAEWELNMLQFKKQELVEMLRGSFKKIKEYESNQPKSDLERLEAASSLLSIGNSRKVTIHEIQSKIYP